MSTFVSNPYAGVTFFEWFPLFFSRLFGGAFLNGALFPDDIQALLFFFFSVNSALLGAWLVLKKLTMMANAISHTTVLGIAAAYYLSFHVFGVRDPLEAGNAVPESWLLVSSICVALATAWLTHLLSQVRFVQEGAGNAIIFSSLFAVGIIIVSTVTRNVHVGVELLMGSPDALDAADLPQIIISAGVTAAALWLLFRGLFAALFDPLYSRVAGLYPGFMVQLLLILVSINLITAFRIVGVIMALAFFVTPPLIARRCTHSLKKFILSSAAVGGASGLLSVALSRHLLSVYDMAVSTGALAVSLLSFFYIATLFGMSYTSRQLFAK